MVGRREESHHERRRAGLRHGADLVVEHAPALGHHRRRALARHHDRPLALAVLRVAHLAPHRGALRERRHGHALLRLRRRERLRARKRDDPRRRRLRAVRLDVDALHDDPVLVHVHEEPLRALEVAAHGNHRHRVRGRAVTLRRAVLVPAGEARIGQRRRADRRELALPDLALVHERTVGVARKGDGVREHLQHGEHAAAVRPAAAVAGRALDRQVLEVEERLAGVAQALAVGHEETGHVGSLLALFVFRVFRRHEVVPLHAAQAHRLVRLAENLLPDGLHAAGGLHNRLVLGMAGGVHVHRHVAIPPALEIVVARAEERHGLGAAEHARPRVAHELQRIERAPVGDVAAHHHGVRAAVLEEAKRLLVARLRAGRGHVDVAHHAERQRGTAEKVRRAAPRHERRGQAGEDKIAPAHARRHQFRKCRFHHAGKYTIFTPARARPPRHRQHLTVRAVRQPAARPAATAKHSGASHTAPAVARSAQSA